ncbi:MAG: tRNA 4-thiouridine(8) synthase ThiI, partial [Ruminococcus sp.]
MKEIILLKYGEIALKGLNKSTFESIMIKNIKYRLKKIGKFSVTKAQSTVYVEPDEEISDLSETVDVLKKIFGIASICRVCVCEKDFSDICTQSLEYLEDILSYAKTFK